MTIRHGNAIVDAIHQTLVEYPKSDDQTIITETADRTGFPLASVLAVFDARFRIVDA
ncbi:hypothetical protein PE067_09150 [Paracoccus sp. DMF-8]|uniref:hypothetical protein n=1 Tax=Paracoccus sp. DMF-8 TaxID=3019445 RepID=UPI0023E7E441|nr:hypothetical protein [Paracoccus sp. DMF-8]MDF3606284.1 hypothetical protein [Paracoccus sp. DMF-8]